MARTIQEQKDANAERMRLYRDKKKKEKAAQVSAAAASPGLAAADGDEDEEEAPQISIAVEEAPKLSFAERIKQRFAPGEPATVQKPVKRATGKKPQNVLLTVFPTVIAMFVSTFLKDTFKDPYKPCAPTQNECLSIFTPLLEELARSIEITGKADETTINLMNALLCTMLYGARAYMTYVQIKQAEKEDAQTGTGANGHTASRDRQGTAPRTDRLVEHPKPAVQAEGHANGSAAAAQDGDSARRDAEAAQISNMLKRDVEGRVRLGLLPPRVRGQDGEPH